MTDNLNMERQYKQTLLKNMSSEICDLKGQIERTESYLDSLKYALKVTETRRINLKLEVYSHAAYLQNDKSKEASPQTLSKNAA